MDKIVKEKISKLANDFTADTAQFLRDMIAIPSISCEEKDVVLRIKQEM